MTREAAQGPGVAHFRRVWFKPTETFLHHTITHCRATRPLLVGHERAHADAFPVQCPVLALHPPGSWAARWSHWRSHWGGGPPWPPFDTRRARRALERHEARVLHAHFGYTGHQLLSLQRRSGLPLVTTFYGEDASRLAREPGWAERYAELFAAGQRFLAEGPHLRRRLVELGCPVEKTALHPITLPTARYPFRARRPRPRGEPVRLFFCASFREKKGLLQALEAVARAREKHPALLLRVGGDGPQRPQVERASTRLGLDDCTRLLGFLSHREMLAEMHAADLFLQPSVTAADGDSEGGAPTTLLEAQACGLPVLATTHADIPWVVAHGESGLLAPERDVEALTALLLTLLAQPERWAELGAAGRERVERFHDAESETRRLESLYLELAEAGPCRAA